MNATDPAEEPDETAPNESTPPEAQVSDQERIDQAIAESFPASDPPSWPSGLQHKEDELTEDSTKEA